MIYLVLSGIFLMLVIAFYFAGNFPLLNTVNYRAIRDPHLFNRYVAKWMALPFIVSVLCFMLVQSRPELEIPFLFTIPLAVILMVVWIGQHLDRFLKSQE